MILCHLFPFVIASIIIAWFVNNTNWKREKHFFFFGTAVVLILALIVPVRCQVNMLVPDQVFRNQKYVVLIKDDICVKSNDARLINGIMNEDYRIKNNKIITTIGTVFNDDINTVDIKKGVNKENNKE